MIKRKWYDVERTADDRRMEAVAEVAVWAAHPPTAGCNRSGPHTKRDHVGSE